MMVDCVRQTNSAEIESKEGEKERRREEEKKRRRGGVTVKGTDRLNEVRSRWTDAVGGTILYSIQVTLSESN